MLDQNDVRRRSTAIGFKRGDEAAHLYLDLRLDHAAIADGRLHRARDFGRFAEGLNRNARHRRDMRAGIGNRSFGLLGERGPHHGPTLLTFPPVFWVYTVDGA